MPCAAIQSLPPNSSVRACFAHQILHFREKISEPWRGDLGAWRNISESGQKTLVPEEENLEPRKKCQGLVSRVQNQENSKLGEEISITLEGYVSGINEMEF